MKIAIAICGSIVFGLEVYVILKLFMSLPDGYDAMIFWIFVAIAITIIHLFILTIFIFSLIKKWNPVVSFGIFIVYLLILGAFFISSVAYNLKTIERKAYNENFDMSFKDSILTTIHNNELAISKYSDIIKYSTNISTIVKWRGQINDLSEQNGKLYEKISKSSVISNKNQDIDSFTLIANKMKWSREFIITWFLAAIWFILEVGLWISVILELNMLLGNNIFGNVLQTVPVPAVKPAEDPIKYSEDWREFIIEFEAEIYKYIDALFNKSTPKRLNNNDEIMAVTGLSRWHVNKMRPLLSRGIRVGDKFLVDGTQGKYQGNFKPEQMKDAVRKIATGQA